MMRFRLRSEDGITLPELLVGIAIGMISLALTVSAVVAVRKAQTFSDEDSGSLATLRTAVDRVEREIRGTRKVYADSTSKVLHVWIDSNRDYLQTLGEQITYSITPSGQLTRITNLPDAVATVVAQGLVDTAAFVYNTADPSNATYVTFTVSTASKVNGRVPTRTMTTAIRLRNADPALGVGQTGGGATGSGEGDHIDVDDEDASEP